jgi:uncharacterized phage-associated protein
MSGHTSEQRKRGIAMAISSLSVANYFIEKSLNSGIELTPMKIIKMVYIAHGWHLAIKGEPLINEAVEAWKFGPVIPSVYRNFRSYRDGQITKMAQIFNEDNLISPQVESEDTRVFLQSVWDAYSQYSGWQLSAITHEKDTPWFKIWNDNGGHQVIGAIIPNDVIHSHYSDLAKSRK